MKGGEELCQKEEGNLKRCASEDEKNILTIDRMEIFACPCSIPTSRFKTLLTFWYLLHVHLCMPELPVRLNHLQHSSDSANGFALSGSIFYH